MQHENIDKYKLTNYLVASLCLILPLAFYFGFFNYTIREVVWYGQSISKFSFSEDDYCVTDATAPTITAVIHWIRRLTRIVDLQQDAGDPTLAFRVADLAGRLDFVLPSVVGRTVAIFSFVTSCYIIHRSMQFNWIIVSMTMVPIILFGYVLASEKDGRPGTRFLLLDPILAAEPAPLGIVSSVGRGGFESADRDWVDRAINENFFLGTTATLAVLAGLAAVTAGGGWRAAKIDEVGKLLRERMFFLRMLIGFQVAIFVLLIVTTKAATDWTTGLVCKPEKDALDQISYALRYYWGCGASGVIVCGLLPAYIALREDVSSYAYGEATTKSFSEARAIVENEGLQLSRTQTTVSILTLALPVLTTPLLDSVKSLLH